MMAGSIWPLKHTMRNIQYQKIHSLLQHDSTLDYRECVEWTYRAFTFVTMYDQCYEQYAQAVEAFYVEMYNMERFLDYLVMRKMGLHYLATTKRFKLSDFTKYKKIPVGSFAHIPTTIEMYEAIKNDDFLSFTNLMMDNIPEKVSAFASSANEI